jgi:hypothetical protein
MFEIDLLEDTEDDSLIEPLVLASVQSSNTTASPRGERRLRPPRLLD